MGKLVLVTGGARSGKSRFAERLAARLGERVLYLATLKPGDEEMEQRVREHRRARPGHWQTLEEPRDILEALSNAPQFDVCVFDCLTLWVSNLLFAGPGTDDSASAAERVLLKVGPLLAWQAEAPSALIVVSNEVGSGLVPEYPLGRAFRDALGEANQAVAAAADEVYLCVAGLAIDLKKLGAPSGGHQPF